MTGEHVRAITTNYDQKFEDAVIDCAEPSHKRISVLPSAPIDGASKYVDSVIIT